VVLKLFSVVDPFDDLAESCEPLNKTSQIPSQEHVA